MMTSSYASLSKIIAPLQPVSISRGKPRWMKGGWLAHCQPGAGARNYDALAPSATALKGSEEEYHRAFAALLAGLDPAAVFADLGENAVLLCFCPVGQMCHRRIVAEWFEFHLGILVPELGTPDRLDTPCWVNEHYAWLQTPEEKHRQLAKPLAAAVKARRVATKGGAP